MRFILLLLGSVVDEIAVLDQFADQRIDLLQSQGCLGATFKVAADKPIFLHSHFECGSASVVDSGGTELLGQRKDTENPPYSNLALMAMNRIAKRADVVSGARGSPQQL
jgi:hypothetical protein